MDWVIEAVVENLEIKQQLMARLEAVVRSDTVISSNTSGLLIHKISAGRSDHFKQHFLGTHFFNPPRYLKLMEIIPTPETDSALLARMMWFGREYLGKGVVLAKDTPNFIANRIGLFATFSAMQALEKGYSIEEIDTLTGTLVGRPKSATFRTADLVGLDTLKYVAEHLYEAIADDERRDTFAIPPLLSQLVMLGALGAKTGGGFYKKVKGEILSAEVTAGSLTYEPARSLNLEGISDLAKQPELVMRLRNLYDLPGRAGDFFRQTTWALLSYSACRLLEIADSPLDVDQAMKWGFGWAMGPFEIWDALGVRKVIEDLKARHQPVTSCVEEMSFRDSSFYLKEDSYRVLKVKMASNATAYQTVCRDEKELSVAQRRAAPRQTLWENSESALLDLKDGVVLFEFRSKGNTLSNKVIEGLEVVLNTLETVDNHGLVIGNDSEHFCGGANLVEMGKMAQTADWKAIAHLITHFQSLLQRIHHFHKPIVAAVRGRALGGGCELVMACPQVVAAAESYIGLVEMGVGLIPGAGGLMHDHAAPGLFH